MYRHLNSIKLSSSLKHVIGNVLRYDQVSVKRFNSGVINQACLSISNQKNAFRAIDKEYNAVCSLFKRSGFDVNKFTTHLSKRFSHNNTSPEDPKKPKKDKEEDEDNKISSLLAKAFLWMLSAYMVIAIISLLFPSSNQPEVSRNLFIY